MAPSPTHPGHGLDPEDERWGARFSLVMLIVSLVILVVLVVMASQT